MEVAPHFRLKPEQARSIVDEITQAVLPWRTIAREVGMARREIDDMAFAFQIS